MPDPKKVSFAQLRVGIMAITAMVIAGVLIFLLTGTKNLFHPTFQLRTFMDDSSGMTENAPVRLNGIPVGDVEALKLSGQKDPRRIVEVDMDIRSSFMAEIPKDSRAGIAASNLLGDKFINITKGTQADHVQPGDEIASVPNQDIPELMAQSANLLAQLQSLLGRANSILTDVRTGKGTISRLLYDDTLSNDVHAALDKLNAILGEFQQGHGTAGKLFKDEALYADLRAATTQFNQMLTELQAGKGTAGKLLKDEQLYNEINQLIAKVDTTIDKVNSGQGTLGQLMVNPQLYETLNGATGELHQLIKDMRANPKKFLSIRLTIF
jgi:phospholipid/cholesterol/gamma-HCH transport system substrate-binding protein